MIVTEEEAKTKRCQESFPAAQALSLDGSAYASSWSYPPPPMGGGCGSIGVAVHTAPINCIGSACMAWAWKTEGKGIVRTNNDDHSLGFCGKARR